jgi:hypothetical protein
VSEGERGCVDEHKLFAWAAADALCGARAVNNLYVYAHTYIHTNTHIPKNYIYGQFPAPFAMLAQYLPGKKN